MKNIILIVYSLWFFNILGYSQEVKVGGLVIDSLGQPLSLVNVLAFEKLSDTQKSTAISNESGAYTLNLEKNSEYYLKFSYLGYETQKILLKTNGDDSVLMSDIILLAKFTELDEVEVAYKMPVQIKGDTIIYNAGSFSNGNERKLIEILKKIPGIEITRDGSIKIRGKVINKLMIDGQDFFDGNPKLATKNLPAKAVDQIQVLNNYNQVRQNKALGNSEDIALNIKLKEDNKNLVFGNIEIGAGNNNRVIAHPNIFYFSPKTSINFIGDYNNIGESPFTFQDYLRFSGGLNDILKKGGATFELSEGSRISSLLKDGKSQNYISRLGGVSLSQTFSSKFKTQGFFIRSLNEIDLGIESKKEYLQLNSESQFENLFSDVDENNNMNLFKLSSTYEPNDNLFFNHIIKVSNDSFNNIGLFNSNLNNQINLISSQKHENFTSFDQRIELVYSLSPKHLISFETGSYYGKNRNSLEILSENKLFQGFFSPNDDGSSRLFQEKSVQTEKLEGLLNYFYVLGNKSHINLALGLIQTNQSLVSKLNSFSVDTSSISSEISSMNVLNNFFRNFFLSTRYKLKKGNITFSSGLNFSSFNNKNDQLQILKEQNLFQILPEFFLQYNFRKTEFIAFEYSLTANVADIEKRTLNPIITSYNVLSKGNNIIDYNSSNDFIINYSNINAFSLMNIYAQIDYSLKKNDFITNVNYVNLNQELEMDNSEESNKFLNVTGIFDKHFGNLKFEFESRFTYNEINSKINSNKNKILAFNQNYNTSLLSNFKSSTNFEIGYNKIINRYNNSNRSTFLGDKQFINLELNILKNILVTGGYELNHYRNKDKSISNRYSFLNADLEYRKRNSNFSFKLSAKNISNTKSINEDFFSDYLVTSSQYFVMPRYFILSLNYDL